MRKSPPAPAPVAEKPRSVDYLDYRDVQRPMMVLVRDQQTGEYNPPHTHRHGQLLYAVSGVMRAETPEGLWVLPPRCALWVPPGMVHDQVMLGSVQMRSVYIDPLVGARVGESCRVLEVSAMLRELILALAGQPIEYVQDSRNWHIVALILSELEASRTLPLQIPWPTDRRLLIACREILDAPEHPRSIEFWADRVGASPRTLIRLFIKETGLTFRQWVQQVRLVSAIDRLEQGQAIGVIASDLGYASQSAFTAMFRRVMGQSPREFLQNEAANCTSFR
ncbi:AraC family transcriptional regulator [Pseudomonas putida]|uniref:AraC family transcriptional regulator n=1 Tax=Pseudomonas putida TaxID=303 RepID=UPI00383A9FD8